MSSVSYNLARQAGLKNKFFSSVMNQFEDSKVRGQTETTEDMELQFLIVSQRF